jgi:predicted Fe-Mo cluster-binding NifX family protein
MKVAVSTERGFVSAHFGRCPSYTVFEIEEDNILSREEIPNPGHQPGFLPQYLSERGVQCIIAGGMGPRAQGLFAQKGIETIIGVQGTVDEAIAKFLRQELVPGEDLCDHGHGVGHHSHPETLPHTHPAKGNKICIPAQEGKFETEVDPQFGRARYLLIVDPETRDYEVIKNPHAEAGQGAGVQTAQLISTKDVGTVLTGNCGPNAQRVLEASGIRVITGVAGTAAEALDNVKPEVI